MRIAYVRVSSADQNEARQIEALKSHGIEKWFAEKVSGKNMDRAQLKNMLEFVREGDTVYVMDFSRLARSTKDLLEITEFLKEKKVALVSLKENLDTNTPTGRLMLTMVAAISEFERENILERQREGIEIAKMEGRYKGRQKVQVRDFADCYARYMRREITKAGLARELHVSRPTVDRLMKEYLEEVKDG